MTTFLIRFRLRNKPYARWQRMLVSGEGPAEAFAYAIRVPASCFPGGVEAYDWTISRWWRQPPASAPRTP